MNSNISVTPNDQRTEGMKESRIINRKLISYQSKFIRSTVVSLSFHYSWTQEAL